MRNHKCRVLRAPHSVRKFIANLCCDDPAAACNCSAHFTGVLALLQLVNKLSAAERHQRRALLLESRFYEPRTHLFGTFCPPKERVRQLLNCIHHYSLILFVQRARRFVQKQDGRLEYHRPCERNSLLLAAAEVGTRSNRGVKSN